MYKLLIADDEPNIREGLSYLDWAEFNISVADAPHMNTLKTTRCIFFLPI